MFLHIENHSDNFGHSPLGPNCHNLSDERNINDRTMSGTQTKICVFPCGGKMLIFHEPHKWTNFFKMMVLKEKIK